MEKIIEVATITADRKELFPQLKWAYDSIYKKQFPLEKDRESLEKIHSLMSGEFEGVHAVIHVLGYNVKHPYAHDIRGIDIGYHYAPTNTGLLSNIAKHPDPAKDIKGIGKLMVHTRIKALEDFAKAAGRPLAGVGIECNDPKQVKAEDDSLDPTTRLSIFNHFGARIAPVSYENRLMILTYPLLKEDGKYHYPGPDNTEKIVLGILGEGRRNIVEPKARVLRAETENWKRHPEQFADACPPPSAIPPNYMKNLPAHIYV